MRSDEREAIMRDAAAGKIRILVSSDHMARGIDLPNIKLVVNYDPPKYPKTYVHRVGRTARANRKGFTVTMLKVGQVGAFKKMRSTIGSTVEAGNSNAATGASVGNMKKYMSSTDIEEAVSEKYRLAVKKLSHILDMESKGALKLADDLL
jgi:ATP-dependent RNA helicase DDX51/DBP6